MSCRMWTIGLLAAGLMLCSSTVRAELAEGPAEFALDAGANAVPIDLELPPSAFDGNHKRGDSLELAQTIGDYGPDEGDWEFTLTGNGFSDKDFDNSVLGVSASLGYFFTPNLEIGVRQSLNFLGDEDDDSFSGATRAVLDYNFDLDHWWPFVGVSFGGVYGDDVNNSWAAGVEGGVKWYVKPETFVFGMIEWLWLFDDGSEFDDQFDDGQWVYTLGIGFNF